MSRHVENLLRYLQNQVIKEVQISRARRKKNISLSLKIKNEQQDKKKTIQNYGSSRRKSLILFESDLMLKKDLGQYKSNKINELSSIEYNQMGESSGNIHKKLQYEKDSPRVIDKNPNKLYSDKSNKTSAIAQIIQENNQFQSSSSNSQKQLQQIKFQMPPGQKQSQRLSIIFESSRKQKSAKQKQSRIKRGKYINEKSIRKIHGKDLSQQKGKLLQKVDVEQIVLRSLRKSFRMGIIESDQEWEDVCSKSKGRNTSNKG